MKTLVKWIHRFLDVIALGSITRFLGAVAKTVAVILTNDLIFG